MNLQRYLKLQELGHFGLDHVPKKDRSRWRVFNNILLISLLTYLIFIPISGVIGSPTYTFIIIATSLILFGCFWLNTKGLFKFSNSLFMLSLMISIYSMTDVLGWRSGIYLCLIPISILPLLYSKRILTALLPWLLCILVFFLLSSDFSIFQAAQIELWREVLVFNFIIIGVIVTGYYYNVFFKISYEETDLRLIEINNEISRKNETILSNIQLAKEIQSNLLPYDTYFKRLFPESFIFYKPKDIVSGDFYWAENVNRKHYCAVIDCTGHGVPGAFVSILGHQGLNRCIHDMGLIEPADILNKLHEIMYHVLRKEESLILDGMDMSIISFDPKSNVLKFSAAQNSGLLVRENELEMEGYEVEYRGINHSIYKLMAQRQSVGSEYLSESFDQQVIIVKPGDKLYLYSDGYVDQFGGNREKKMMHKQFKKLILSLQEIPMEKQNVEIRNYFNKWKGDLPQIDDICVIGMDLDRSGS